MSLHISGYRTPTNDASPDAPNAANAAPLMPVCDACNGAGLSTYSWANAGDHCSTCDGTGRLRATREGFPAIIRPGHLGADESLPAYAYPGGYPLAYYPCTYSPPETIRGHAYDEHAEMVGDVCCADCATAELHDAAKPVTDDFMGECAQGVNDELCFISQIEEEVSDQHLTCDNCYAVIAYQTYCHDCHESVECDEEHPFHLCPATEPYTVRYLTQVPGTHWQEYQHPYPIEGPTHAASIARGIRERQLAAFVHYQPSRLDFPPVIEEEEN